MDLSALAVELPILEAKRAIARRNKEPVRVQKLPEEIVSLQTTKDEMIEEFEKDITRVQLSSRKKRDHMTPQKFYKDVIKGDSIIKKAYRSYYLTKMSSLKAADIKENLLG